MPIKIEIIFTGIFLYSHFISSHYIYQISLSALSYVLSLVDLQLGIFPYYQQLIKALLILVNLMEVLLLDGSVAFRKSSILKHAWLLASSKVFPAAIVIYSLFVFKNGVGIIASFKTVTFTVTYPLISIPQVADSPSPITACKSPIAKSAPGTFTGKNKLVPS